MKLADSIQSLYRRLFARPRFRRLNRFVLHLGLRGLGVLNYESPDVSGERHLVDVLLPKWLGRSPVIFDVGAHVGAYSRLILERFPHAVVHAFEPNPVSRDGFVVAADDGRLTLHPVGLGAEAEARQLFDRADDSGSSHASLYSSVISELHDRQPHAVEVEIATLDEVCSELGLETIDFLKIDVEGHELAVLAGAEALLKSGSINLIQFEFNEMNVMSRTYLRDFRLILAGHRLYRLLPNGLLPVSEAPVESELFGFQNILAVPAEWDLP